MASRTMYELTQAAVDRIVKDMALDSLETSGHPLTTYDNLVERLRLQGSNKPHQHVVEMAAAWIRGEDGKSEKDQSYRRHLATQVLMHLGRELRKHRSFRSSVAHVIRAALSDSQMTEW